MRKTFQNIRDITPRSGFVLLFAVTLAALLLSISLGMVNIAYREIRFGTNAVHTNEAVFAADTAIECALFHNNGSDSYFDGYNARSQLSCSNSFVDVFEINDRKWEFTVEGLGSAGKGCAKVSVTKEEKINPDYSVVYFSTIVSNGYNSAGPGCVRNASSVERQLKWTDKPLIP
jgi:hypothetical protein